MYNSTTSLLLCSVTLYGVQCTAAASPAGSPATCAAADGSSSAAAAKVSATAMMAAHAANSDKVMQCGRLAESPAEVVQHFATTRSASSSWWQQP
jgi:hypothetical protein